MAQVAGYFSDFLTKIRLTENQINDLKTGHTTLRERLLGYEGFNGLIISTFLQGSYKRATAVKPHDDKRADVDVVVVTNLDTVKNTPDKVVDIFKPFLDKFYKGKYTPNGRSIGIEMSYVDLDLVVTVAPDAIQKSVLENKALFADESIEDLSNEVTKNSDKWQLSPLLIPDRDVKAWVGTHPLEQIRWTIEKNNLCNGNYVNVVKAIKWWQRVHNEELPKYPKGYPLEHIVGYCCPDGITTVADGVTLSFERIVSTFAINVGNRTVPNLPDHGVPEHNVLKRISWEEFSEFYEQVRVTSVAMRRALDETNIENSVNLWREIFGDEFGPYVGGSSKAGGFIPPYAPSDPRPTQRFG